MATPLISIVMSVYNGQVYVGQAIDSVLNQIFKDFEFIIINDGSTDNTEKIIKKYTDKRIRLVSRENRGLVASLNEGIKLAKGEFIARQDADDASEPNRLKLQIELMKKNLDLVLVGSSMKVMDEKSKVLHTHHVLLNNTELKQELLVRSPFAHGSVMFKKSAAIKAGLYRQEYWPAEDYDLWLRLSYCGKFANVNDPLYVYRENSEGISLKNQQIQITQTNKIRKNAWSARSTLLGNENGVIKTEDYMDLDDGQFRLERILANLKYTLHKSIRYGDFSTALKIRRLIIKSGLK